MRVDDILNQRMKIFLRDAVGFRFRQQTDESRRRIVEVLQHVCPQLLKHLVGHANLRAAVLFDVVVDAVDAAAAVVVIASSTSDPQRAFPIQRQIHSFGQFCEMTSVQRLLLLSSSSSSSHASRFLPNEFCALQIVL